MCQSGFTPLNSQLFPHFRVWPPKTGEKGPAPAWLENPKTEELGEISRSLHAPDPEMGNATFGLSTFTNAVGEPRVVRVVMHRNKQGEGGRCL
jgi:hypothetical protein